MADRLSSTHKRVDDLPRGPGRRTNRTAPRSQTAPQATAATLRDRATVSGQQPGPPIAPHQATIPSLPPHNRPCSFPRPRNGPQSNPFAAPHSATNPGNRPPPPQPAGLPQSPRGRPTPGHRAPLSPKRDPPRPHGPTPEGRHTPTADPIGPHRPRPALRSPPGPGPPPPPGRRQPVGLAADRPSAPAAGPIGSAACGRSPEDRPGNTGSPRGAQALLPAHQGKRGAAPGASRGGAAVAKTAPGRGLVDRSVLRVGTVCRNGPAADDRTRGRGDRHAR
jgi:hypothetical protein